MNQMRPPGHAYPEQLAAFVRERWSSVAPEGEETRLPDRESLVKFLSVCYQASLMREEERPVNFRVILIPPDALPEEAGPPTGLHKLSLAEPRSFDEDELRRLSPAVDYHRSLIGVELLKDGGEFRVWGMVQSGPRWILRTQGGREFSPPLPPVPVVHVAAPGRIELRRGSEFVAKLEGGDLLGDSVDVFTSQWISASFAPARAELARLHAEAREKAKDPWPPLDDDLTRMIGQHAVRRMVSVLRDSRHGGTILFVPPGMTEEFSRDNDYVTYKYRFDDAAPRRRYRSLTVGVTNRLVEIHGKGEDAAYPRAVGWREYQKTPDPKIANFDEAIFEFANMIAALASVDGAVVMSKRMELLGFGAEISGSLKKTEYVQRALDLEGTAAVEETVDGVGTRHRSAYRFISSLPGAVAVVVSQDGSVRFMTLKNDAVTYWDHA